MGPGVPATNGFLVVLHTGKYGGQDEIRLLQYYQHNGTQDVWLRYGYKLKDANAVWTSDWSKIEFNIPTFYKNYNSISALAIGLGALRWVPQISTETQLNTLESQSITYFSNAFVVTIGHGTNADYKFQFRLYDQGKIDVRNTTGGNSAWKSWVTLFTR